MASRNVCLWPLADAPVGDGRGSFRGVKRTCRFDRAAAANDAVDGAHSAASECQRVVALKQTTLRGAVHGRGSTIGLAIAKAVFQVHGVDGGGAVTIRKRISRSKLLEFFGDLPPCLV